MCDDRAYVPVRAARAVSVKELARATASILREVELDGNVVVLSRRGTMVALLTPLPERTVVEIKNAPRPLNDDEPNESADPPPDVSGLDDNARALLAHAARASPMPFSMDHFIHERQCGVSAAAIAFTNLESDQLVENGLRGRRATRQGVAAARWLDSDEAGGHD